MRKSSGQIARAALEAAKTTRRKAITRQRLSDEWLGARFLRLPIPLAGQTRRTGGEDFSSGGFQWIVVEETHRAPARLFLGHAGDQRGGDERKSNSWVPSDGVACDARPLRPWAERGGTLHYIL